MPKKWSMSEKMAKAEATIAKPMRALVILFLASSTLALSPPAVSQL